MEYSSGVLLGIVLGTIVIGTALGILVGALAWTFSLKRVVSGRRAYLFRTLRAGGAAGAATACLLVALSQLFRGRFGILELLVAMTLVYPGLVHYLKKRFVAEERQEGIGFERLHASQRGGSQGVPGRNQPLPTERADNNLKTVSVSSATQADRAEEAAPVETPRSASRAGARPSREQIFLSYASPNRDYAKSLAEALHSEGWSVWWDRTIPPGKSFDEVIEAALNAAQCVVVLWSVESVNSNWVKNEAREGARRQILIPAMIADTTIPFEFRHIQAADLAGWPSPNHSGFQSLVASIRATLGDPEMSTGASAV